MPERTVEQILNEAVFAVALVARHYGSGFSADGLVAVRELLSHLPWHADTCYRVDVDEGDPHVDFHTRVYWADMTDAVDFDEVIRLSKAVQGP